MKGGGRKVDGRRKKQNKKTVEWRAAGCRTKSRPHLGPPIRHHPPAAPARHAAPHMHTQPQDPNK